MPRIPESPAEAIRRLHSEVSGAMETAIERAIEAGRLLIEQKEACKRDHGHGKWGDWLATNIIAPGFSRSNVNHYMKMYRRRYLIQNPNAVRNIKEALHVVYTKRKKIETPKLDEDDVADDDYTVPLSFNQTEREEFDERMERIAAHYQAETMESAIMQLVRDLDEQLKTGSSEYVETPAYLGRKLHVAATELGVCVGADCACVEAAMAAVLRTSSAKITASTIAYLNGNDAGDIYQ